MSAVAPDAAAAGVVLEAASKAASGAVPDARHRLPREPYPGLRPFLDFEAALLFGRTRQVRDVIARLRETQFVAVLGGSGSGKSSLIHAGVTPELRSFGIPGAGDLWLPMVCTPGTNVAQADREARRTSPITRLARRFAALLRSRGSPQADAQRVLEVAEVFRQEAGFARLLDTFGAELAVAPGPDPAEARVLFVLDQFEEIFHPTNKGVADAALLVERVLDHFFNPHPHCYVVLTMRSEHLNDAAAFLELPDAINKSSYLVRRLDADELREAIVGPAQRFLRLMARVDSGNDGGNGGGNDGGNDGGNGSSNGGNSALPAQVEFAPAVLARLLRDVQAITHDPDHLPLLQHLLARLWQAALEREEMHVAVPAQITVKDLERAVGGGAVQGDEEPLAARINTLRACVENWPESLYQWHAPVQQLQLDELFRQLAFKDPNTGLYSQQRVDVQAAARRLGPQATGADLRALLAEGFLGSVDYLFWDDEDAERVTLKVSHESFIRGWSRFRQLADLESERFDAFVGVMRKCADWSARGGADDFLLETSDMRRLRETDVESRLARPEQRAVWFRFLLLDRDGARLARLEPVVDGFLAASGQRQRQRAARQTLTSRSLWALGAVAAVLALVLVPPTLFSWLIQTPVTERAQLLFNAGNRANSAALTLDYPAVGAAGGALASLLLAAESIDDARTSRSESTQLKSQWLLDHLARLPPVQRQDAFLKGVAAQSEPPVNGKLRQLLSTALWHAGPRPAGDLLVEPPPVMLDHVACLLSAGAAGAPRERQGRLFYVPARGSTSAQRRAVFVPAPSNERDANIVLYGATYDTALQRCTAGKIVLSIPVFLNPSVVFDASLRYFMYSAEGANVEVASATLYEIDWDRAEDGGSRIVQSEPLTVVTDPRVVSWVREAAGAQHLAAVPTWLQVAGRVIEVSGQPWRLVSTAAQQLDVKPGAGFFEPLLKAPADSVCLALPTGWPAQAGFLAERYETATHCFAISRGNDTSTLAPGEPKPPREEVLVAVFDKPMRGALQSMIENPPSPIAALPRFARVTPASMQWFVGTSGEYLGWLALHGPDASGKQRLIGAPWSTCALWRLGKAVQFRNPAPAAAGAALSADQAGLGRDEVCTLD